MEMGFWGALGAISALLLFVLQRVFRKRDEKKTDIDKELASDDTYGLSAEFWRLLRKKRRSGDSKGHGDSEAP
jgi:hypothetical protein